MQQLTPPRSLLLLLLPQQLVLVLPALLLLVHPPTPLPLRPPQPLTLPPQSGECLDDNLDIKLKVENEFNRYLISLEFLENGEFRNSQNKMNSQNSMNSLNYQNMSCSENTFRILNFRKWVQNDTIP
jgi:hypothetical protein